MVGKDDEYCYICGDPVPKQDRTPLKHRSVSPFTNLVFLASLGFTAYCFFGEPKLSLPVTLVISSALLLIRILADQLVNKNPD